MNFPTLVQNWDRAYRKAAKADGYAWIIDATRPPDGVYAPTVDGKLAMEATLQAVTCVMHFRSLDAARTPEEAMHVKRVLAMQTYGRSPAETGAAMSVGFVARPFFGTRQTPCRVVLHVHELRDLDLEDLREMLSFDTLDVQVHGREITSELEGQLVQELRDDLSYSDEEIDVEGWVQNGVLIANVEEQFIDDDDDSEDAGAEAT